MVRNAWCFDWTDAAIARLKELWGEGFSASECGKRMGVSRNAVIGKIHRLGLSGKYRRPREGRRTRMRAKGRAIISASSSVDEKNIEQPARVPEMPQMRQDSRPAEEPRRGSFGLLDLKLGQCRYPHGERPFSFCGAPIVDGYPYCLEHVELCYNKPVVSRAAAA